MNAKIKRLIAEALKHIVAAFLLFWLSVVIALIVLASVSWQAGLITFAVGLAVTIVLIVTAWKKVFGAGQNFVHEVTDHGSRPAQSSLQYPRERRGHEDPMDGPYGI